MATFDRLQGTPSCMKIVQLWTCTFSFSFSLSSSTYLGPFMVVLGGTSYRPAAPRLYMAPRSLGSAGVSWSLQHISCQNAYLMVARYKLLHGAFDKKQHFLPLNENPMSMTSGKVQSIFFFSFINGVRCGVLAGMWEFSLHSLLEVIAVPFKRKTARIFLQGLFGERLTICLIERSSMGVGFRGRPDLFLLRALSIVFDVSIGHRWFGATQFSSNIPFCISFSM